jgi:hypothetical protein
MSRMEYSVLKHKMKGHEWGWSKASRTAAPSKGPAKRVGLA